MRDQRTDWAFVSWWQNILSVNVDRILVTMAIVKNTTRWQTNIYFYRQHLQRWQIRCTRKGRSFEHRIVVYILVTLFHISVIHSIFNLLKTHFSFLPCTTTTQQHSRPLNFHVRLMLIIYTLEKEFQSYSNSSSFH